MRAGLAIIAFGMLSSLLPSDGAALAAPGPCTPSTSSALATTGAIVVGGAGAVAFGGGALGLFPALFPRRAPANPNNSGQVLNNGQTAPAWPAGNLDNFIYAPQGPIGPNAQ